MALLWFAGLAALAAIGVGLYQQKRQRNPIIAASSKDKPLLPTTTYVIGDLHGDVECGKYWVNRLGLVDDNNNWLQPQASLVFMGDYCDKGPYSFQTMQYVKSLTDAFPDRVTALMGNHELELLRDRHPETQIKYMQLAYSSVHPQEYLNYLERDVDEKDLLVVDLLINASIEVYGNRWHQSFLVAPEVDPRFKRHGITEFFEEGLRPVIKERLQEYQDSYLRAFASNTTLGRWVERLDVAHVENGVFFCHGGISESIVEQIQSVGGVDAFNELVKTNSNDTTFLTFLESPEGRAVYEVRILGALLPPSGLLATCAHACSFYTLTRELPIVASQMLIYRGNHKSGACDELNYLLDELKVERLAVGHTPGENVRSSCSDKFWAVDSLLGRWIRTSGNFYCPTTRRESQNGRFVCDDLVAECEGQVVKVTREGVEIIA